jgi:protein-tyrosine phosphatase
MRPSLLPALLALIALFPAATWAKVAGEAAARVAPDRVAVTWRDPSPVDVYVSDRPDADVKAARLVVRASRDGRVEAPVSTVDRPYFLLRDTADGTVVRTAERVLPLQQGSNFRDLGGYPAAGAKRVRWGRIYRSGATPLLTETDLASIHGLGLSEMVDLRSAEERSLAPTRIQGVAYQAVGYSMAALSSGGFQGDERIHAVYRNFPTLLAPQLRLIFADLLAHHGAVAYNCSAGQDRTGFATAMVLSALGVSRDVILADYHLSTTYRRPAFEAPAISADRAQENAATAMFYRAQQDPAGRTPKPLYDSQHQALLEFALAEIDQRWGSTDAYLAKEIGVGPKELAQLRALYLE